MTTISTSGRRRLLLGCEQRELVARQQLPEVSIEADEVLAQLSYGR
jgi:hypothetical protein